MIDDLKEQEGVHGVRGLRTGRGQLNSCAAFCFRKFAVNLLLESRHCRGARRVRVANEHGCLEISGRKRLGDVSKVRADLLNAGFVVRVFCGDGDFSGQLMPRHSG